MEITETPQQNTGGTEQASGSGKVNLNTAGKEELNDTLRHRREPCGLPSSPTAKQTARLVRLRRL